MDKRVVGARVVGIGKELYQGRRRDQDYHYCPFQQRQSRRLLLFVFTKIAALPFMDLRNISNLGEIFIEHLAH